MESDGLHGFTIRVEAEKQMLNVVVDRSIHANKFVL